MSLCSVRPEDRFVILCPRVGIFDFEKKTVVEWLDFYCLRIRCFRDSYWLGSFAFVAWSCRHPVGCGFGFEVDDGAVVGVENPADGGRWGTWRAGFGEGNGLP